MADLLNIELARPGVWNLASGKTEFTTDHLKDAADFFTATGGQKIPLALGHNDPRFSGDPSFGNVANVRFEEDDRGPVLLGDLVDMPEWLHAAAPKRWPNRSVEGYQDVEYGGRRYKLALTALALLGVTPPGVRNIQSLKDLRLALAASAARHIVAMAPDEPPPDEPASEREAPAEPGASSSPAPVTAAEAMRRVHAASTKTTATKAEEEGAGHMDPAKIREALGLAPDVSDDEVKAALVTAGLAAQNPAPPADPAPEPPKVVQAAGTMTIDVSAWAEQQDRIKRLEAQAAKQLRDERDKVIAQAVTDGKFAPSRKDHWARLWDADPEGTRQVIDSLARNVIPVMAMGYSGDNDEAQFDEEFARFFPPEPSKRGA